MRTNLPTFTSRPLSQHRKAPRPGSGISFDTGILIIDDDRHASIALAFMLGVRGYDEIRAVRSATRATAIAASFAPGIIFLDLELPNVDALDLAKQLRKGSSQNVVRLIAMTSTVEHPLREEARQAGFERFLVKPSEQAEIDKILHLPADNAA
jgi:CheY-like chemotaxis protein